jgi:ketosteroid isomerase-like protein
MKRIRLAAPPLVLLLAAGMACAPATEPLSSADLTAIGQVSDAFLKGFAARDFAAVAGLYLEDGVLNAPNHPALKGRTAVTAFLEAFPREQERPDVTEAPP